ncbi:ABC transporter ATP-binding protein [Roseibium marinum]|uniref:Peptide/nickel transport system ATP-binding protein/oligopeptide transport system ATP-binding protein n=1 Tax=Roseibium marinum TaxID=281252 RepID=A0A2S3UKT4_9HYPH|nr:ABC transporter ATP-binding protein [Roseibium marinum]POF28317.1 peptide/nickel transport system ATP-binding protein/oligopeptide transport system ATP-binding protein [Roseibium marinum]
MIQSGCDLIEVRDASVDFVMRGGFFAAKETLSAVDTVNLTLNRDETVAIVGESGSGKSTLGRLIIGDQKPTGGSIKIKGQEVRNLSRLVRSRLAQPVVQDPSSAMDPRWTIESLLEEPFRIHRELDSRDGAAIRDILSAVRLSETVLTRRPHELSGGQLQRVAIARALLLEPEILVCDEAVSALDASVQAEIVGLLKSIQKERHTAILFITHDLHLVPRIADRIAVMYLGQIVEIGSTQSVGGELSHPYTRALFGASPKIGRRQGKRATLQGEPPSPTNRLGGCPFHPRCSQAWNVCNSVIPALTATSDDQAVACHLVTAQNRAKLEMAAEAAK